MNAIREVLGQPAEQIPRGDAERHNRQRQHEQHRHEDELDRDRRARPDLELDPRDERIGGDQDDGFEEREGLVPVERRLERARRGEEREGEQRRHAEVARARTPGAPCPRFLDQVFVAYCGRPS